MIELDCGDQSCRYAANRGGMRTNGGCQCIRQNPEKVELYLRKQLHYARLRSAKLLASIRKSINSTNCADDIRFGVIVSITEFEANE